MHSPAPVWRKILYRRRGRSLAEREHDASVLDFFGRTPPASASCGIRARRAVANHDLELLIGATYAVPGKLDNPGWYDSPPYRNNAKKESQ